MAKQGMRGTGDFPANQRPGNFGEDIKLGGKTRVTRADMEAKMKQVKGPPIKKRSKKVKGKRVVE